MFIDHDVFFQYKYIRFGQYSLSVSLNLAEFLNGKHIIEQNTCTVYKRDRVIVYTYNYIYSLKHISYSDGFVLN